MYMTRIPGSFKKADMPYVPVAGSSNLEDGTLL